MVHFKHLAVALALSIHSICAETAELKLGQEDKLEYSELIDNIPHNQAKSGAWTYLHKYIDILSGKEKETENDNTEIYKKIVESALEDHEDLTDLFELIDNLPNEEAKAEALALLEDGKITELEDKFMVFLDQYLKTVPSGEKENGLGFKADIHVERESSPDKNANGVPFGTPDPKLKCALFRVLNPRTETYKEFREDLDEGGVDTDVIDGSAWPLIYIQKGAWKAWMGEGLDTSDLDGYVDGVMSHKDLYWPIKDDLFDFLKSNVGSDGMISALDIYDGKDFIASKYDMDMTFASYLEVSLVFLKCGGDSSTGKVSLESVLEFLDARPPSISGRVTRAGIDEVNAFVKENRETPSRFRATNDILGLMNLGKARGFVPLMRRLVL